MITLFQDIPRFGGSWTIPAPFYNFHSFFLVSGRLNTIAGCWIFVLCFLNHWFLRKLSVSLFSPLLIRPSALLWDVCCLGIFMSLMHLSTVCPDCLPDNTVFITTHRPYTLAGFCAVPTVYLRADRKTGQSWEAMKPVLWFNHSGYLTVCRLNCVKCVRAPAFFLCF